MLHLSSRATSFHTDCLFNHVISFCIAWIQWAYFRAYNQLSLFSSRKYSEQTYHTFVVGARFLFGLWPIICSPNNYQQDDSWLLWSMVASLGNYLLTVNQLFFPQLTHRLPQLVFLPSLEHHLPQLLFWIFFRQRLLVYKKIMNNHIYWLHHCLGFVVIALYDLLFAN